MNRTTHSTSGWSRIRSGCFDGSEDVYAIHAEMRRDAPVWQAPWGDIYVSRYDLVAASLADRRLSHLPPADANAVAPDSALRNWLIYQEGHTHAAIRAALQKPFAGRGPAALRPFVDEAVELLCAGTPDGDVDVVGAFARAVPERIIGRLLGVPVGDLPQLRAWSASIRDLLDVGFDDAFDRRISAVDEMSAYFTGHARALLKGGELPMLLSGLPGLVEKIGLDAAGANLALLAFSGHETTVHLTGNLLYHLTRAPDQFARLRADPSLTVNAVAEALRLESPVQKICRWPTETIDLAGHALPEGRLVVLLVGAANRDASRFAEPDNFILNRPPEQNLAFGRGLHICIGRALAEIEAHSILAATLKRWSSIEPVEGGARWLDNSSFRGLERLVLRLAA